MIKEGEFYLVLDDKYCPPMIEGEPYGTVGEAKNCLAKLLEGNWDADWDADESMRRYRIVRARELKVEVKMTKPEIIVTDPVEPLETVL